LADPLRILLTGPPGCGKTTVILRTWGLLSQPATGFYTEELRGGPGGSRLGFDVVTLDGRRGPLARVGRSGSQVGKYAVDLSSFEDVGVRAVEAGLPEPQTLLVIDEVGKMELLSAAFVTLLERAFQSPNPLLGTILHRPHPLADRFRHAPGVELIQVATQNRDALPAALARRFTTARSTGLSAAAGASVVRDEQPTGRSGS
jgi:nucleoside-triphosphatase